ncbi:MAG: hypothetical protein M3680_18110, partial [Myxococcota bacterium]|nr:hypothetical protein [Myxococcota bacterium]
MTHPLVEQAQAALCRLADAPPAAEAARLAVAELESLWTQELAVGIGGELQGRTELFNEACGGKLLDPFARCPGSAALRIRRGPATTFRVHREDGSTEEHALPPDRQPDLEAARARVEAAQGVIVEHETAIALIPLPQRPRAWQVWRWPAYWIARWLARDRRAAYD